MKFIKNIIFILSVLFLLTNKSYSEVVNKLVVVGNKRVSAETVKIFGDVVLGNNYESSDINLLIKKLYDTTFFSDIAVELENNILKITLKENPIINTITFDGEKAKKYKEAISEQLVLKENASYLDNFVKTDIGMIKEFYRQLGFYFVKIDAEILKLDNNRVDIIYAIDKGDKAKISKIFFLGDKKVRDGRLRNIITSQEAKFWKFISRNVYLNKGRIELDKRLLKNYYRNKGYYEVEISSTNVEYSEGEGFVLTFVINAGNRYRFQKIYADVAKELDASAFASLEKEIDKLVGKYYSQKKLTEVLEEIDSLTQTKELQFINHRVEETLDGDNIEVKISIFEGQKFTIERINIVGNSVTNDSVIRGELIVDEGDPYSALLINKSINKLKARNIFGKVEKKISEGSTSDLKVLQISVEEKATGEIAAGAGVGTDGTSFMFSVSENNWLGRGIKLETALNVTEETISGNLMINNPNFNYSGNKVYTALDISSTDLSESSGYESSKTGFSLGTEFEQYRNIWISPSLSASNEDIEVKSSASSSVKKMEGNFTNVDLGYGITVDRRNQPYQPTAGYRTKFNQTIPIVLDQSSLLNGFTINGYNDYGDDVIGAFKFYARTIHGLNDDDVRLTSRLFLPQSRLRGFNTRKVGPKDGEDWIGGNYTTALTLEAQLPNLLPEATKTDVSLFIDSGNVWHVDYADNLKDANKLRAAFGVSANVFTTIGPLTFTLAQNLAKSSSDETETFNFRLGTSF